MQKAHWDGVSFHVDPLTENNLRKVYPFYEIELRKMEFWYVANPRKRKKNHFRFIVNWLNKVAKDQGVKKTSRDYSIDNTELKEKMKAYESSPPPSDWLELKKKLARNNPLQP